MMKMYTRLLFLCFFACTYFGVISAQNSSDSLLQLIEAEPDPENRLLKRIKALEDWVVSDPALAEDQLAIAMPQAKKLDRIGDLNWLMGLAAEVQLNQGESKAADSLIKLAIQACPDSSANCPPDVIAHFYNLQGHIHFRLSDYVSAGKAFQQTSEWYERSGAPERAVAAKFNSGSIYLQTGLTGKAIKIFKEVIPEIKDSSRLVHVYNNLGTAHISRGDMEKALEFLLIADNIPTENGELKEQVTYNIALAHEDLGQYERASVIYEELAPQLQRKQNKRMLARTYLGLGKSYMALNQPAQGRAFIQKAEELLSPEEQPTEYVDLLEVKHEVNRDLGNYQTAYEALFDMKVLRDTLELREQRKQFAELQEKYEAEKKEAENQELKMREELNLATIEKQRLGLIGSIVAILLALGILVVFWRQNRIKTRYNRHLEEKNKSIDLLHRELKHRVHNNLSFILSMLRLQRDKATENEVEQKLQENIDRVQAVSLVYNKLDAASDDVEVDLNAYLTELIEALLFSVSEQQKTPESSLDIAPVTKDPQTAMQLGIILNELVTNSLKYAFTSVDEPRIEVQLREQQEGQLHIEYADNGPGFSQPKDESPSGGFGLSLIESLVDTLDGQVTYSQNGRSTVSIHVLNQND